MTKVKLSDIAMVAAGSVAPKAQDFTPDGIPFVRAGSLSGLLETGDFSQLETVNSAAAARLHLKLFPAGTVVFAKSGMSCLKGYVYTLPRECYAVSHLACVIPNDGYSQYLQHYFRYWRPNRLIENPSFPSIKLSKISDIELNLPDSIRAKEIVDNLEAVLKAIAAAQLQIKRLDELVKSRFVEMFGDPIEDEKWPKIKLDELCSKLGSGATPRGGKSAYKDTGIPLVRSMNVHNGAFIWKDLAYIDDEQADRLKGVTLRKGDVLLNITGASVARSCLLPDELAGGRVNQHVAIVRPDPSVIVPIFLNSVFICDSYQHFLLDGSQMAGATREAITKQDLRAMQVPTPPLALQQEFAAFVQQVDKLKFIKLFSDLNDLLQQLFGNSEQLSVVMQLLTGCVIC